MTSDLLGSTANLQMASKGSVLGAIVGTENVTNISVYHDQVMEISTPDQLIHYPRGATIFASVCAVLFVVVGVTGNLVTILALTRCNKLRNHATTAFVISLCTSDLLFCGLNLPLTAARYIKEAWVLGDTLCNLFPFFFYGNVAASLMSMVAITVNRYILIACHATYDRIYARKYVILMILFAWAFSFGMLIPPLVGVWGRFGLDPPTFSCTILKKDGKSPKKFLFILGFLLPCIVIIVCYSCIYFKVRRSRRNVQAHSPVGPKLSNSPSMSRQQHQRREDLRVTRMMLTIFCCFLFCFLPLMLVNVADDDVKYPTVHVISSVFAWASSVINTFIYAVSNRQYRNAYRKLLCKSSMQHRGSFTQSRSGSGKTFITEMLQYNAVTEKVKVVKANGTEQGDVV